MHRLLRRALLQLAPVAAAVVGDEIEADAGGEDREAAVLEVAPVLLRVGIVARRAAGPADGDQQSGSGVGLGGKRLAAEAGDGLFVQLHAEAGPLGDGGEA